MNMAVRLTDFLMEPDRLATIIIVGPFLIAAMFLGIMVHINEK